MPSQTQRSCSSAHDQCRLEATPPVAQLLDGLLPLAPQRQRALHRRDVQDRTVALYNGYELRTLLTVGGSSWQCAADLALQGRHQRVLLLQEARGHPAQTGVLWEG